MTRRSYTGAAAATSLASPINSTDMTATLAATAGLPTLNFVVTVDQGLAGEEKILVTSRSGTTLTLGTRGFDGTVAASHTAGAVVLHTLSATDLDEANAHVNDATLHNLTAVLGFTLITASPTGTNHTGFADLDATNYKVTFTAPSSGKALLRLVSGTFAATGGVSAQINVRVGGADVALSARDVVASGTGMVGRVFEWYLTGLSGSVVVTIGHNVGAAGSLFSTNSATAPSTLTAIAG